MRHGFNDYLSTYNGSIMDQLFTSISVYSLDGEIGLWLDSFWLIQKLISSKPKLYGLGRLVETVSIKLWSLDFRDQSK